MNAVPPMPRRKQLALIAHDNRKADLLDWARFNRETLAQHELHATGTTGALLKNEYVPVCHCCWAIYEIASRKASRRGRRSVKSHIKMLRCLTLSGSCRRTLLARRAKITTQFSGEQSQGEPVRISLRRDRTESESHFPACTTAVETWP